MKSLTARSALVALMIAAPFSGAFAGDQGDGTGFIHENNAVLIDRTTTQSIGNAASSHSLHSMIRAAETNLSQAEFDAGNPAEVNRLKAEISSIRQAARAGVDSATAQELSQKLSEIQRQIYAL